MLKTVISLVYMVLFDDIACVYRVFFFFCLLESVFVLHFFPICDTTVIENDNDCN